MKIILLLIGLGLFLLSGHIFAKDVIIYPRISEGDKRYYLQIELLNEALEITKENYGDYTLKPAKSIMSELRYIAEVKNGERINVIWRGTNEEIERELLPIRIPLLKGILGYRIFLINKDEQDKFSNVKNIEDLRKFKVGQGFDWGDVEIFKYNNLEVITGTTYEGLFSMLMAGRFDYFSRGVNEAFVELKERKDRFPNMTVEKDIVLHYPWPYYFFVSPKYPRIAERLEKGLNLMISDGTFDKIFYKYNKENINQANLQKRRMIKIENPFLPKKTPLERKELWYIP